MEISQFGVKYNLPISELCHQMSNSLRYTKTLSLLNFRNDSEVSRESARLKIQRMSWSWIFNAPYLLLLHSGSQLRCCSFRVSGSWLTRTIPPLFSDSRESLICMSKEFLRFKPPKLPLSTSIYLPPFLIPCTSSHPRWILSQPLLTILLHAPGYELRLRSFSHRRFGQALSRAHFNASLIFDLISVKMIRALGRSRGGRRRRRPIRPASTLLSSPRSRHFPLPTSAILSPSLSFSPSLFVADESSPRKNPFA